MKNEPSKVVTLICSCYKQLFKPFTFWVVKQCEWKFEESCGPAKFENPGYDWECDPRVMECPVGQYPTDKNSETVSEVEIETLSKSNLQALLSQPLGPDEKSNHTEIQNISSISNETLSNSTWSETIFTKGYRSGGVTTVINLAPVLTNTIGNIQPGWGPTASNPLQTPETDPMDTRLKRNSFDINDMEPQLLNIRKELRMMNRIKAVLAKRATSLQDWVATCLH